VHSEVAGHRGVKATVDKLLRAGYNRSNLQQEVEYVIANCGFCQKIANRRQDDDKSQPRFNEIMEVGEEWSLNTIGPLPADESGNTYIMVAIDGFSRFVVLEPASDASGDPLVSQWQDSCSSLSVGSADQREFEQTVGRSTTII
jgi:hypothetical protein